MDTNTKAQLTACVAAGYVIGRTKKGKVALSVVSLIAGRSLDPVTLVGQGLRKLAETPQFAGIREQVRGGLVGAGKTALSDISGKGVDSLTAALQERTRLLLEGEGEKEDEGEAAEEPQASGDDASEEPIDEKEEQEAAEEPAGEEEQELEPRERRYRSKTKKAATKRAPAKRAAPRRAPPGKSVKKTSESRAPARKPSATKSSAEETTKRTGHAAPSKHASKRGSAPGRRR